MDWCLKDGESRKLIRLYGCWYDMTEWEERHPGGPIALALSNGRDATTLFELHHPFTPRAQLECLLADLRVSLRTTPDDESDSDSSDNDVSTPPALLDELLDARDEMNEGAFDWSGGFSRPSAFRCDLISAVRAHFADLAKRQKVSVREAIKPKRSWWLTMFSATILMVFIAVRYTLLAGELWSLSMVTPLAWFVSASLLHEGSHFALSMDWRVNYLATHCAPWLSPGWCWSVQHVIGHHAFTNLADSDPDLYHWPSIWRYAPAVEWVPLHAFQTLLWPGIWALATVQISLRNDMNDPLQYEAVAPMLPCRSRFWWRTNALRLFSMFAGLFGLPLLTVGRVCLWRALVIPVAFWCGLSFLFMAFSQVTHLDSHSVVQHCRDDFFKHQVLTSQDYAPDSAFWTLASVGLNLQAVHHLFPTVSCSHYRDIHPLIAAVCSKHGVPYKVLPSYDAVFRRWFAQLHRLSKRPCD